MVNEKRAAVVSAPVLTHDAEFARKLGEARMRLLRKSPFFGMLLLHMNYALVDGSGVTCGTDGKSIVFATEFLSRLKDDELDFTLLHLLIHAALGHCHRRKERDEALFHRACDIVTNSNAGNACQGRIPARIDGRVIEHLTPDGENGYDFSAEEIYAMLQAGNMPITTTNETTVGAVDSGGQGKAKGGRYGSGKSTGGRFLDDHDFWEEIGNEEWKGLRNLWEQRLAQAAIAVELHSSNCGDMPLMARRQLKVLREAQLDWRELLANFIQLEVNDYSFSPPDRRFQDSPFLLPDWNDARETLENLWFVVDTSGSISDHDMTIAYSEIAGTLALFDHVLDAKLSFFDSDITAPIPFGTLAEFLNILPQGGGGTDFSNIFKYLKNKLMDRPPACIIILTDGCAPFPQESDALGIPVLWIINNLTETPPWGKVARMILFSK